MENAAFVSGFESFSNLFRNVGGFLNRHRSALQPCLERLAL
jgi:hypothetical protein